jgi:hypothetical protein
VEPVDASPEELTAPLLLDDAATEPAELPPLEADVLVEPPLVEELFVEPPLLSPEVAKLPVPVVVSLYVVVVLGLPGPQPSTVTELIASR